jgi:hypothetical protein
MVKEKGKFSTHHQEKGAFFFKVATDDQHTVKKRLAIFLFPAGMSGVGSSAELGMPRNDGNRSESIPRNFAERNSVPNPIPCREYRKPFLQCTALSLGALE